MIPISTAAKQDFRTPAWLRSYLMKRFRFTLDAAATAENSLCKKHYGPGGIHEDALEVVWQSKRPFFNPHYEAAERMCDPVITGKTCDKKKCAKRGWHRQKNYPGIMGWLERPVEAIQKGYAELSVGLLPANTGTKWFAKYSKHADIELLTPRVAYENEHGEVAPSPPHASMLMIFTPETCARVSDTLSVIVRDIRPLMKAAR